MNEASDATRPDPWPWHELLLFIKSRYGSQKDFAAAVGVSPQTVSDWVTGQRGVVRKQGTRVRSPRLVDNLAQTLRLSADDLRELGLNLSDESLRLLGVEDESGR